MLVRVLYKKTGASSDAFFGIFRGPLTSGVPLADVVRWRAGQPGFISASGYRRRVRSTILPVLNEIFGSYVAEGRAIWEEVRCDVGNPRVVRRIVMARPELRTVELGSFEAVEFSVPDDRDRLAYVYPKTQGRFSRLLADLVATPELDGAGRKYQLVARAYADASAKTRRLLQAEVDALNAAVGRQLLRLEMASVEELVGKKKTGRAVRRILRLCAGVDLEMAASHVAFIVPFETAPQPF